MPGSAGLKRPGSVVFCRVPGRLCAIEGGGTIHKYLILNTLVRISCASNDGRLFAADGAMSFSVVDRGGRPKRSKWLVAPLVVVLAAVGCSKDPEVAKKEFVESGDNLMTQKKYAEAVIQYKNAIGLDQRYGEARLKLAKAAETTGDAITAFREYVRAADLLPEDPDAQLRAGQMLLLAKQYPEARVQIGRAHV